MYNTSIDIEKSVKMRKNLWFHEMYGLMLACREIGRASCRERV